MRDARDRLADARQRLDDLAGSLDRALRQQVDDRRNRLARLAASLEALSPLAVLARGYALASRPGEDAPIRDARDLRPGESILIRLASGSLLARVEEVIAED
jgi:exodeoxyribonuclease VII large subunit